MLAGQLTRLKVAKAVLLCFHLDAKFTTLVYHCIVLRCVEYLTVVERLMFPANSVLIFETELVSIKGVPKEEL